MTFLRFLGALSSAATTAGGASGTIVVSGASAAWRLGFFFDTLTGATCTSAILLFCSVGELTDRATSRRTGSRWPSEKPRGQLLSLLFAGSAASIAVGPGQCARSSTACIAKGGAH